MRMGVVCLTEKFLEIANQLTEIFKNVAFIFACYKGIHALNVYIEKQKRQ